MRSVLGVLVAAVALATWFAPAHASAAAANGMLTLSPASGPPGTAFTATFTFGAPACPAYTITFNWDATHTLGQASGRAAASQTCEATLTTATPAGDDSPRATPYQVSVSSSPSGPSAQPAGFTVTSGTQSPSGNSSPGGPTQFSLPPGSATVSPDAAAASSSPSESPSPDGGTTETVAPTLSLGESATAPTTGGGAVAASGSSGGAPSGGAPVALIAVVVIIAATGAGLLFGARRVARARRRSNG